MLTTRTRCGANRSLPPASSLTDRNLAHAAFKMRFLFLAVAFPHNSGKPTSLGQIENSGF